jgi:hypothetical protein
MLWLGVILVSAGCRCSPVIHVNAVGYENLPLRVDLVGVSSEDKARWGWDTIKMSDYWKDNSDVSTAAKQGGYRKEIIFQNKPHTVGEEEPVWKTWEQLKAVDLYILILPYEDRINPKPRRVSLDYKECWKNCTLEITIEGGKVSVVGNKCSN